MNRFKLILPALCLIALPAFAVFTQDPGLLQDKKTDKSGGNGVSARVSFGAITYTDAGSQQPVTVLAKGLLEVRLIAIATEGIRLELLYQNGDYSMVKPTSFHFVRKADAGSYEVLVTRTDIHGMAFPFVN